MIILYELIDFIKVIRINMLLSMPKCLSNDSAKSCAFSAFVLATLRRGAVLDGRTDPWALGSFGSLSKLAELQNFSKLAYGSTLRSSLTCFCN